MKVRIGLLLILVGFVLLVINPVQGYKINTPDSTVHQYISKESKDVWNSIPNEIQQHLTNEINNSLNIIYNNGDDIITGTGEEDLIFVKIDFSYEGGNFTIEKVHTVLISEPVPLPGRNY